MGEKRTSIIMIHSLTMAVDRNYFRERHKYMTSWGSICETLKYCSRSKHADSKTFEMRKMYAFDIYTDITRVPMLMILENFECFCEKHEEEVNSA
jgi:hypothetical protein